MFYAKTLGGALVALALIVPSVTLAQSTTGTLTVYVQVNNQYGSAYTPGSFAVSVSGVNPSPSTFQGSINGTLVSLNPGSFSVSVAEQYGFTASYSTGCNNTIAAGQSHTCIVTMSGGYYNGYPFTTTYPYNYNWNNWYTPALSCHTDTPRVGLGQTARFVAQGGVGGTYNWYADSNNFPNAGPVLTTTFNSTGSKLVKVTNAAQTATCAIEVVNGYVAPYPNSSFTYPTYYNQGYNTYPVYGSTYPTVTYQASVYPRLPNTGFEPVSSAQMAFAVVLLMGVAIASYPYARKAFALALR